MDQLTKARTISQRMKMLIALRKAGINGLTNIDFTKTSLRYNARLQELYKMGYKVEVNEFDDGITQYILLHEPEVPIMKHRNAIDILLEQIDEKYQEGIKIEDLVKILDLNNLTVKRKVGSFNQK